MTTLVFAAVTFLSTLLGGLFALRFRDRLHLIVAFAAGVRLGAAFFDLLPESLRLGDANHIPVLTLMTAAVLGLLTYHVLEGTILLHSSSGLEHLDEGHRHVGILGAAGFSAHSFLDGVSIGLAFQAGYEAGILVAAAVIAHDFSDGLNTVTILLRNRASAGLSYRWLLVDATTPLLGAASTFLFQVPEGSLGLILAGCAGFFIYLGAIGLLPEAHHEHGTLLPMTLTTAGVIFIYVVTQAVH
jgi:zinc transporter ZupT